MQQLKNDVIKLLNRIDDLENELADYKKIISQLKIDNQLMLKHNTPIPAGISTKIAYDSNGLILKGSNLQDSDIPELSIDKIKGLKDTLNLLEDKVSNQESKNISTYKKSNSSIIAATGTKINYDENGHVVSSSDLIESDIPMLHMNHIKGLQKEINAIKSTSNIIMKDSHGRINPSTATKITFDNRGHVIASSKLDVNDIPAEIINRLNKIENEMSSLASQTLLDSLSNKVSKKVDTSNDSIKSGSYTKVCINSNGLVVKGSELNESDIPELSIHKINGLYMTLKNKCDQSDFLELNETVSNLLSTLSSIGEIKGIKNELNDKASQKDLLSLSSKIESNSILLNRLIDTLPNDTIMSQLNSIQSTLSNLSGRISVLENKLI